jgi:hypothetical protein
VAEPLTDCPIRGKNPIFAFAAMPILVVKVINAVIVNAGYNIKLFKLAEIIGRHPRMNCVYTDRKHCCKAVEPWKYN